MGLGSRLQLVLEDLKSWGLDRGEAVTHFIHRIPTR